MKGMFRFVWWFRVELALGAVSTMFWQRLADRLGFDAGSIVAVVSIGVVLVAPRSRKWLRRLLRNARVRRQWHRAVQTASIRSFGDRSSSVFSVQEVPAGHSLDVFVPLGASVPDLQDKAEVIAAALAVRQVRLRRDPANAARAQVVVVRLDPLAQRDLLPWPHAESASLSLWEPIPLGVDEDGQVVTVSLPEHNMLLGGEPGAGKSASISLMVATAALDPDVKLWLLDGKLVELATWAGCAEHNVGVNVAEAVEVLRTLQAEMDLRYAQLLAGRKRKVTRSDGLPLHVVVCDELALYLTGADRKGRTEFAEVLRDLVARGRAAGVIVLAATQKPSADVVPTYLRDLFGFRWALRCSTREASDTILGSGWASLGYSAADVDAANRGVGYLLHEGGLPVRLRSYYLDDPTLLAIADRAEALRRGRTPEARHG